MAYKIIVSPLAQIEIEDAIDYYALNSASVVKNFIIRIKETYHSLAINPFFKVQYKNVRALKINKFPYAIYFVINETENTVRILSCFHHKKNPSKTPK